MKPRSMKPTTYNSFEDAAAARMRRTRGPTDAWRPTRKAAAMRESTTTSSNVDENGNGRPRPIDPPCPPGN